MTGLHGNNAPLLRPKGTSSVFGAQRAAEFGRAAVSQAAVDVPLVLGAGEWTETG